MREIVLTLSEKQFLDECSSAEIITDNDGNSAISVGSRVIQIDAPDQIKNSLVPIIALALRSYKAEAA